MLDAPGPGRPSLPTGTYVRGFGHIFSDGISWNQVIIHVIHLDFWADLEIPDKKVFPGDKHGGSPR